MTLNTQSQWREKSELLRQLHVLVRMTIQETRSNPDEHMDNIFKWQEDSIDDILDCISELFDTLKADTDRESRLSELGPIQMMLRRPKNYDEMPYGEQAQWVILQAGKIGSRCDERIKALSTTTGGDNETNHKGETWRLKLALYPAYNPWKSSRYPRGATRTLSVLQVSGCTTGATWCFLSL